MPRRVVSLFGFSILFSSTALCASSSTPSRARGRVEIALDTSEADAVLRLVALRRAGKSIAERQWQELFATEPYRRLKQREAKIGEQFGDARRAFTDDGFKEFILSEDLIARSRDLASTLERWRKADLHQAAARILQYLPPSATIRAKVYPVIKPARNSFVWELSSNPAIFLYVDPGVSAAKFDNTVAHELHHIGLASVESAYDREVEGLPEPARNAAKWMGAFGEGLAMLAAAGGPDVHPHAASSPADRSRWDRDLANFSCDLRAVNGFFLWILDGKLTRKDLIDEKGSAFFGVQGPWYTVGYKMALVVEKRFGREALIDTMLDPRRLLVLYNIAATEWSGAGREQLPLWSEDLLRSVGAKSP